MGDISKGEGRTVLFVSHNMSSVKSFCKRGIVLENGKIVFNGIADKAVQKYLIGDGLENINLKFFDEKYKFNDFKLNSFSIKNKNKIFGESIVENQEIELIIDINIFNNGQYDTTFHIYNEFGEAMFSFYDTNNEAKLTFGNNKISCVFPSDFFQSGMFTLSFFLVKDKRTAIFMERDILSFNVVDGQRELGVYMGREPGYIRPQFKWQKLL